MWVNIISYQYDLIKPVLGLVSYRGFSVLCLLSKINGSDSAKSRNGLTINMRTDTQTFTQPALTGAELSIAGFREKTLKHTQHQSSRESGQRHRSCRC